MNALPADLPPTPGHTPADASPRVVVVRDPELADRLGGLVGNGTQIENVSGALSAMADVAQRGAARVVIPAALLDGIEASGLATFKELGVGDRLVLVDADDEQAVRLHEHGAAVFVEKNAQDADWLEVLGHEEPVDEEEPSNIDAPAHPTPELPLAWPVSPVVPPLDQELGDADLVEAILDIGAEGGRRAPVLALAVAHQQSGIEGLAFAVEGRSDVPEGHAAAPVSLRGRCYGRLHAPAPTHSEQLTPWAAWLARWIALDQQARQLRDMAMRDELTGVWNRRYFNRFLSRILNRAGQDRQQVTLMVFDIDNFKTYNDTHGHSAGDDILKATAELMQTVVRDHDVVARIGGDEFAVIFWDAGEPREAGSSHPDDVLNIAKRFQQAVCELKFPALARKDMETLTISGGLAGFPWDGRTPEELLHHADLMAMESKRKGKNAITFGSGALRCELPERP